MANETYLTLVNSVLKRLREPTVGTVDTNILSRLIGEFVNEAKAQVEQAWDWTTLRETITLSTADGTKVYSLTGAGENPKFLLAFNDTLNAPLRQRAYTDIQRKYLQEATSGASPYEFAIKSIDSSGDVELELYPTPAAVESLVFRAVVQPTDLSLDTDTISVPQRPIVQLALAMATAERGEEGSISATEQFAVADRFLSDAIALDIGKEPLGTDWWPQ